MEDWQLLEWANEADRLAEFCQNLSIKIGHTEKVSSTEMARFLTYHQGDTPDQLQQMFGSWHGSLAQMLPRLQEIIKKCNRQAEDWRNEYARLHRD